MVFCSSWSAVGDGWWMHMGELWYHLWLFNMDGWPSVPSIAGYWSRPPCHPRGSMEEDFPGHMRCYLPSLCSFELCMRCQCCCWCCENGVNRERSSWWPNQKRIWKISKMIIFLMKSYIPRPQMAHPLAVLLSSKPTLNTNEEMHISFLDQKLRCYTTSNKNVVMHCTSIRHSLQHLKGNQFPVQKRPEKTAHVSKTACERKFRLETK